MESYLSSLQDLKERRISAGLILGELSRRNDTRISEEQGCAEAWTREFLAEIQQKDVIERRQEVGDLQTLSHLVQAVQNRARWRHHPRGVGTVWLTTGAKCDRWRGLLVRGVQRQRRCQPFLTTERYVLSM